MPESESLNTMFQQAFVSIGAQDNYALQISGVSGGGTASPIETSIPVAARATSATGTGSVADPAAQETIAETAAIDQGTWDVAIRTVIAGTTVAALEIDNMEVVLDGVAKTRIMNPVPGTAGSTGPGEIQFRYDGDGVILVRAAAAGTAGSIYAATIVATRIN